MKYLKLIENNNSYVEITHYQYYNVHLLSLNDQDILKIKSLLSILNDDYTINIDYDCFRVKTSEIVIFIRKLEDDYFLLRASNDFTGKSNDFYYKCDQILGLKEVLKKYRKLKINEYLSTNLLIKSAKKDFDKSQQIIKKNKFGSITYDRPNSFFNYIADTICTKLDKKLPYSIEFDHRLKIIQFTKEEFNKICNLIPELLIIRRRPDLYEITIYTPYINNITKNNTINNNNQLSYDKYGDVLNHNIFWICKHPDDYYSIRYMHITGLTNFIYFDQFYSLFKFLKTLFI